MKIYKVIGYSTTKFSDYKVKGIYAATNEEEAIEEAKKELCEWYSTPDMFRWYVERYEGIHTVTID